VIDYACRHSIDDYVCRSGIDDYVCRYNIDDYVCRYSIDDYQAQMKYVLNLNTSICLEAHGDCVVDMVIFKNTTLPKLICDWSSGFTIPGQTLIKIQHF
jgi:hypothetical protein